MLFIGIVCVSASLGYLFTPPIGWLFFGGCCILGGIVEYINSSLSVLSELEE
jgi:hypothetical protein